MEPVKIVLGDKEREIKFDLNAFAELEKKFGTVDNAMQKMQSGGMGSIKVILWVGLIHEEVKDIDEDTGEPTGYNITPYQVGSWITMGNMEEVSAKLTIAMTAGLPEQKLEKISKDIKTTKTVDPKRAVVVPTKEEEDSGKNA
jgi:hypothetical protein